MPRLLTAIAISLGLALITACAAQVDSLAKDPGFYQKATQGITTRSQTADALNQLLQNSGNTMVRATHQRVIQKYWYLKWHMDWFAYYELREKSLAWEDIERVRIFCGGLSSGCLVQLKSPWGPDYLDVSDVKDADAAQRLHALVLKAQELSP